MALNSQLLTVQILTNDVQVLILGLSHLIDTVFGAKYKYLFVLPNIISSLHKQDEQQILLLSRIVYEP